MNSKSYFSPSPQSSRPMCASTPLNFAEKKEIREKREIAASVEKLAETEKMVETALRDVTVRTVYLAEMVRLECAALKGLLERLEQSSNTKSAANTSKNDSTNG